MSEADTRLAAALAPEFEVLRPLGREGRVYLAPQDDDDTGRRPLRILDPASG